MFVRSKRFPLGRNLRPSTLRLLIIGLYTLYPLGCILRLAPAADEGVALALDVSGLLIVAASLVIFAVLAGSSLQRQSQEEEAKLDERELAERNRAAYVAHSLFAGIVLLGVMYLMIAKDLVANGKLMLWLPETGDHWNGIFWGLLLAALTLPGAVMAWRRQPEDEDIG